MLNLLHLLTRDEIIFHRITVKSKQETKLKTIILNKIFFKKKRRMRILGARIFSKFFGGKIKFNTGSRQKKWCMRVKGARIFL